MKKKLVILSYCVMWSMVSAPAENTSKSLRTDLGNVDREQRSGGPSAALGAYSFYVVLSKTPI